MFKIVKRYYDRGIYDAEAVRKFVLSGTITEAQYEEIVNII